MAGAVGAGFSIVPGIVLVAWLRRRASEAEPEKREARSIAADRISRGLRQALGVLLFAIGGGLLAAGMGIVPTHSSDHGSRLMVTLLGILLMASAAQVGGYTTVDSRFSRVLGSVVITSLAVMFGWVALYGDAANFHGGFSIFAASAPFSGSATLPRILFGLISILTGLASLWSWKQVFRPGVHGSSG